MREALEVARELITAQAEAVATQDFGFIDRQVGWAVVGRDRDELVKLVQALVRLSSLLAALPTEVLVTLGPDNVPPELVERFGNPQAALQTAWLRVAAFEAGE